MDYDVLYVIGSQRELSSRGLAFESGTTIDFEKYSILAIKGWSLQNIDSITHRFTDDDGLYFLTIDIKSKAGVAIDPVWIKAIAVPSITTGALWV